MNSSSLAGTLLACREADVALMAFNVQNVAQLTGLCRASEICAAPVIAQISAKYAFREALCGGLSQYARLAGQGRIYLHLDHCVDEQLIHHCVRQGFDSVMFDGSGLPLEDNVIRTNAVAEWAHRSGCLVEAELGRIGGVEDDLGGDAADSFAGELFKSFCGHVQADMIAPAIGNAHGFYADVTQVHLDLLPVAQKCLRPGQFLVLHGGTGLPLASLQVAAKAGVVKINISTQLKKRTQELLVQTLSRQTLYDDASVSAALAEGLVEFYSSYLKVLTKQ